MLDLSLSGSELEGFESDGSLESTTELIHVDGGASTSRDFHDFERAGGETRSQSERERVILRPIPNLIMKPLRVVGECIGLKGGRKKKGFGYEILERNTLLPLAKR